MKLLYFICQFWMQTVITRHKKTGACPDSPPRRLLGMQLDSWFIRGRSSVFTLSPFQASSLTSGVGSFVSPEKRWREREKGLRGAGPSDHQIDSQLGGGWGLYYLPSHPQLSPTIIWRRWSTRGLRPATKLFLQGDINKQRSLCARGALGGK